MTSIVLAALDTSAASRPVLENALRLGELTGAAVEAVHVTSEGSESFETLESVAARSQVPFRLLEGPVEPALLDALGAPEVIAAVMGARSTTSGRRPVGGTAGHILEHADKPVLMVPPDAISPGRIQRLLLPLEGTEASSRPVLEWLQRLLVADVELVVLHVFTDATLPRMLNHPGRDVEILGREFLSRHFPNASRIELRAGPVAARVGEVAADHEIDLVVLSWSQDSSTGRANIVREVLGASALPILLLPGGSKHQQS